MKRTPSPLPTPQSGVDAQAETELYVPSGSKKASAKPKKADATRNQPKARPKQQFDWTPVVVVVVMLLSAVAGYFVFVK